MTGDRNIKAHVAIFFANVIFGVNMAVTKSVLNMDSVSPLALNFFRIVGSMILFWSLSLFLPREKVPLKDLGRIVLASFFAVQFNQLLFLYGVSLTSPVDASIMATVVPIVTMILASLYLKEPITWKKAAGVAIGAAGAIMLIVNTSHGNVRSSSMTGNMLCLLSAACYASYLAFFKPLISRYTPVTFMKWMFLSAVVCNAPFCVSDVMQVDFASLSLAQYARILYVVVFATFIAYILIPVGQKKLRPTIVGMYNYIQPLVASLLALALNMDSFGWGKTFAALMVFTGVWLVTKSKSREQMER